MTGRDGEMDPEIRASLLELAYAGASGDELVNAAISMRRERGMFVWPVDSRVIYDDSDDGGYESGSYFAHAMSKDD